MTREVRKNQIWKQKNGVVCARINFFCKAYQCPTIPHEGRSFNKDHVHVTAWHGTTMAKTNHNIVETENLYHRWECHEA